MFFVFNVVLVVVKPSLFSCRVTPQLQTHAERHDSKEAASHSCKEDVAFSDIHVVELPLVCLEERIHRKLSVFFRYVVFRIECLIRAAQALCFSSLDLLPELL